MLLYIAHCYQSGLAASTTRTHIAALSFTFQLGGYQDLTQNFLVKKQLQGFSKVKPAMDNRLPITPNILSKLVSALPSITTSAFSNTLFHAMYVLAFSAFLRVGEITKTACAKQHFLLAKHVTLQKDPLWAIPKSLQSLTLNIPISLPLCICRKILPTPYYAPRFLTLQTFMDVRGHKSPEEPLFSLMDGTPVSRQFFTKLKVVPVFLQTRYR